MEETCILLYNLKNSKGFKIEKLCRRLEIKVKHVEKAQYLEAIGVLIDESFVNAKEELYQKEEFQEEEFLDEMLVMSHFSDKLLDFFLKEYKNSHLEPVALKAMVTPHNKEWNSFQLAEELKKEARAFNKLK